MDVWLQWHYLSIVCSIQPSHTGLIINSGSPCARDGTVKEIFVKRSLCLWASYINASHSRLAKIDKSTSKQGECNIWGDSPPKNTLIIRVSWRRFSTDFLKSSSPQIGPTSTKSYDIGSPELGLQNSVTDFWCELSERNYSLLNTNKSLYTEFLAKRLF